ncbi:MAG: hypothetical protein KF713_12320 [Turneriella sp.]|nr:hypothetical protein [Turneriella sp.]
MTRVITVLFILLAAVQAGAEEILSSRPVVIAPKRIETETTLPVKAAKRSTKKTSAEKETAAPAEESALKESSVTIDDKNILMKVSFQAGSIQLSRPIRKQLIALGIKPGQKIRITGFGSGNDKKSLRLANLRARVVASFLAEAIGEIDTSLQWSGKPHTAYPEGAVIEAVN